MKYSLIPQVSREVFIQLLLPTFFVHLTRGLLVSTLPLLILEYLNRSKMDVGFAVGAIGLGKIIGDIPWGFLLGRIGAKNLMIISGAVISLSACLSWVAVSLTSSFWFLVMAMLVYGLGQGAGVLSRMAMISERIPKSERGRVSALLGGSQRLAMAIGPALGGLLMSFSLSALFMGQAISALGSVVIVFITKRTLADYPGAVDFDSSTAASRKTRHTGGTSLSRPEIISLIDISIFVMGIQTIRECRKLVIPLAGSDIGMSDDDIGWYTSVSYAIDAILFSTAGMLMDTFGRNFAGCISVSLMVLAQLVAVPGISPSILLMNGVISGIGNGLSSGILTAYGADLAPSRSPESKAEFLSYFRLMGDVGEFVGPIVIGIIAQFNTMATLVNVVSTFSLTCSFWLLWRIPEPLREDRGEQTTTNQIFYMTPEEFGITSREETIK